MVAVKVGTTVNGGADVGVGLQAQHINKHPNSKVLMLYSTGLPYGVDFRAIPRTTLATVP